MPFRMVKVRVEDLKKDFSTKTRSITAVDGITFTVEDGKFCTLVGPSGCGKTTTLRMIAGLENPTSGDIYFDNRRVTDLPPQKRDLSMVFQDVVLYPHMTIYENIKYGLSVSNDLENHQERIENIANLLEISDLLTAKPSQLSGGQRQRVALGRAFVREPSVILLDEPLSDLDAKLQAKLRVVFQRLHAEFETTMIYVTHNQKEAMTMSDQIILLRDGQIEQKDPPQDIFSSPRNLFVGQFMGEPTMNVLSGEITGNGHITLENGIEFDIEESANVSQVDSPTADIEFGFRPQHVHVPKSNEAEFLTASVDVAEPIGTEYILHLVDSENNEIQAVVEDPPRSGVSTIRLSYPTKAHIFDSETGDIIMEFEDSAIKKEETESIEESL